MNEITQEQYEDAVLMITGRPEWNDFALGLIEEIKLSQQNVFTKDNWDAVCEEKGFCRGLAYVITLREQVIKVRQERTAQDADV